METGVIRRVRSDWQDVVAVCGKCSKKVGGGFGPKGNTSLVKALRKLLGLGKGRKARIGLVETKCLGVCPRRAVVVGRAGHWLVVPEGAEVAQVAAALGVLSRDAANDRDAA